MCGLSNISFGLNPAARVLLNSVFLDECVKAGLDSAIVHASKILPIARFSEEEVQTALDLIYDRRAEGYDPLQKLMALFEGATTKSLKAGRAEELAALPLEERLKRRIIGTGVFDTCGYHLGNVNRIADSSLDYIPAGDDLTGEPCP